MLSVLKELEKGLVVESQEAMQNMASSLVKTLPHECAITLSGDLGAGKTVFVKGLARGLSITQPITSPSYNIYYTYYGDRQLIHIDAYRLKHAEDLQALMLEDFIEPPYCIVIEWPEKTSLDWVPTRHVFRLHLAIVDEHTRKVTLIP